MAPCSLERFVVDASGLEHCACAKPDANSEVRCDSPRSLCPLWDLPILAAALTAVHLFQRWQRSKNSDAVHRQVQLHNSSRTRIRCVSRIFRLSFLARNHYGEAGYTFVNTQTALHSYDLCDHLHGQRPHRDEIRVCPRLLTAVLYIMGSCFDSGTSSPSVYQPSASSTTEQVAGCSKPTSAN